jgi:hypothetical protein
MVSPLGKASTVMRTRIQDIFATCAGLVQTQRKAPGRGTGRELLHYRPLAIGSERGN